MTKCIALLRAVNLGSHNKVAMSDLRAAVEKLGMTDVKTLIQSGNLVFSSSASATAKVESTLEAGARKLLGLDTTFYVRTAKEWDQLIAANPFPRQASEDPSHTVLMTLRDAPGKAAVAGLRAAIKGREVVETNGREAYFVYPDGIGNSKLTIGIIERKLGTTGTARNWNTVLKLAALVAV